MIRTNLVDRFSQLHMPDRDVFDRDPAPCNARFSAEGVRVRDDVAIKVLCRHEPIVRCCDDDTIARGTQETKHIATGAHWSMRLRYSRCRLGQLLTEGRRIAVLAGYSTMRFCLDGGVIVLGIRWGRA